MFDLNPLNNPDATWQHWVLAVVAGLIGFVLGYLSRQGETAPLETELARLEQEVSKCLEQRAVSPAPKTSGGSVVGIPAVASFSGTGPDDLKIIEGIGPKIEELLNAEGIRTFANLAATDPGRLRRLLNAAGPRFQIQDPTTWPQQAQLAAENRWDELKALQRQLTAGRA